MSRDTARSRARQAIRAAAGRLLDSHAGGTGPGSTPGTAAPGEYPASGPAYPNGTPTTDEPYYPPPTEGEVRR